MPGTNRQRRFCATRPTRKADTMTTEIPDSIYGFVLPIGLPCVWAARAIYYTRPNIFIDLVHDRMCIYGDRESEAVRNLHRWLNKNGMPELLSLCIEMHITVNDYRHIEYQSDGYIIKATPNGSHGYLYIVGYPLSQG